MTTANELYQQMTTLVAQISNLDRQAQVLRKEHQRLKREMSEIILAERYNLKLGDVIEVTERPCGDRVRVFRMKLDTFELDSPQSNYPAVEGVLIKKNGQVGIQRKRLHFFENVKFSKVDEALQ